MPSEIFTASSVRVYSCHVVRANSFKIILGGKAMSDSAKKIKHFIFMRFFSFNDPKYPHDIYDVDFLSKQLILTRNALGSLENQTNKNFDLVFMVNAKFFNNPKYEFVFSTLKDSTTLPLTFIKSGDVPHLVQEAYDKYDYVIQSRYDFDDFLFKNGIADTQNKVDECNSILGYGYSKGYEYICKEIYPFLHLYKGIGYHSILASLILKSSFAKTVPFIGIWSFSHGEVKSAIENFLEKNGLEFSENMFQQNTTMNAFIYFKHEFSHFILTKYGKPIEAPKHRKSLTTADITKKTLEDDFGFHHELNSIE